MTISSILPILILSLSGGLVFMCKSLPEKAFKKIRQSFTYRVYVYQYDELFMLLEKWLYKNYNQIYREVEAYIDDMPTQNTLSNELKKEVGFKQETNMFIIKHNGKKIVISKEKEKFDKAQAVKDLFFRKYTLTGIRCKTQINDLLQTIYQEYLNNKKPNEINVYRHNCYGEWTHHGVITTKSLDRVIINTDLKNNIIYDISEFIKNEKWYEDVNIPYKRGYLFHGPPGTGKTTLALAMATFLKRNVYCLSLNSFEKDDGFSRAIGNIPDNTILLIEDIDKAYSGRENIDTKISFSTFINCLDGALYKKGLVTILTTNHNDKLDEALIRPGRIDFKAEVLRPTHLEISEYMSLFFNKPITVFGDYNIPMSQIQEICIHNKSNYENAIISVEKFSV